jgi:hypothetical protein
MVVFPCKMCCGVEPNEPGKKKGDKDAAREERLYTYPEKEGR